MKVVLVAQDTAPSLAFEMLAEELTSRGHEAKLLIGKGKVFPVTLDRVRKTAGDADIVVIGMSSSAELAKPETAACEEIASQKKKILLGFYGDTYYCYELAREDCWLGPYRRYADFFFAINENDAEAAKNVLVKPTLIAVATGNPIWEDYSFQKYTRAEVRAKYGVSDDELLALAPGVKTPAMNIAIWSLLIEALSGFPRKARVMIAYHPGDRTPYAVDLNNNIHMNIYGDLKTFSSTPVEFLSGHIRASDVLPGADVVVEWSSSVAIEAAHQRIPVISVSTEIGRKKMLSLYNTEKWEPCELGIAEEVRDLKELRFMLEELADDSAIRQNLLETQAKVYPKPQAKGSAVKKMADTLESL